MRTLYLCGAGNSEGVRLARAVDPLRERWDRVLLLDDDAAKRGRTLLDVEIAGPFGELRAADPDHSAAVNLVARTTLGRIAARRRISAHGVPFASLVHPGVDTFGAELRDDVLVYQNATIGPESSIGAGSVVFMGAVVGHESRLGNGCVMGANSVLNARVELGDGVYVGTNATVLPEVRVGAWATIGAGSVVFEDVPPGATAMGVPAEILTSAPASHADTGHRVGASPAKGRLEVERTIVAIWQELLELPTVETDQNFFDLGGCSLTALRMRELIVRTTGAEVRLTDIFRFPTVGALARHIAGEPAGAVRPRGLSRAEIRRQLRAHGQAGAARV